MLVLAEDDSESTELTRVYVSLWRTKVHHMMAVEDKSGNQQSQLGSTSGDFEYVSKYQFIQMLLRYVRRVMDWHQHALFPSDPFIVRITLLKAA